MIDFTQSTVSWRRPLTSYSKVQSAVGWVLRNRAFHITRRAIAGKEYLDIGCGPNTHDGFINMDYGWHPHIDVCWDVTKGLPLPSASLKGVFTEHCLEHLSFEATDQVLAECWRILRPGGTVRIVVPDGELYIKKYSSADSGGGGNDMPYSQEDYRLGLYSRIMSVNRIFRNHGHQFIYDFETLRLLLERNRFVSIVKETYHSGRDPRLVLDTEHRAQESLYVEASRPA